MNIDSDNFEEYKAAIIEQIGSCDFMSIDLELTGIKGEYQDSFEELPFERYLKLRRVSMKYNIIQVGLSLFSKLNNQYGNKTYTFYLFPQDVDEVVGMQVGSINFNVQHGMDWNRWIRKGIGYVNEYQDSKLTIQENELSPMEQYLQISQEIKPEDKQLLEGLIHSIEQFHKNEHEEMTVLDTKNSYQRKLAYIYLEAKHQEICAETMKGGNIQLTKMTQAQLQERNQQKQLQKEAYYNKKTGFSAIWKAILQSKKTVVGHNCFGDIMFLYSHFIDCPPIQFEKFKEELHLRLPTIYDTKYIFSFAPSLRYMKDKLENSTSVENLAEFIKQNVPQIPLEEFGQQEQFHDAGYDAYVTGYIYIHLVQLLTKDELNMAANQLYQFKSNHTINLTGQDNKINPNKLIYVKLPDKKTNLKPQQMKKQHQDKYNSVNKAIEHFGLNAKMIHFKYLYIEVKNAGDFDEILQTLRMAASESQDSYVLQEKEYNLERKEFKERDAKDKLDRR